MIWMCRAQICVWGLGSGRLQPSLPLSPSSTPHLGTWPPPRKWWKLWQRPSRRGPDGERFLYRSWGLTQWQEKHVTAIRENKHMQLTMGKGVIKACLLFILTLPSLHISLSLKHNPMCFYIYVLPGPFGKKIKWSVCVENPRNIN